LEIEAIQEQIVGLRELVSLVEVDNYFIARDDALFLLSDIYRSSEFDQEIDKVSQIYQALSLVPANYAIHDYEISALFDSLGGFYAHPANDVYILGDDFDGIIPYFYAFEYDQALIDLEFNTNTIINGLDCAEKIDTCFSLRTLLKADAKFLADQWLAQHGNDLIRAELLNFTPLSVSQELDAHIFLFSDMRHLSKLARILLKNFMHQVAGLK
jgi:hypothetical protein